jgi:acyl-CoA thioester hydrolase
MSADEPYRGQVEPGWIDYNGHMNVAYYVLAFDHATDHFFDQMDIGAAYRARSGHSLFALEAHVTYDRELQRGEDFTIETQLIDADRKRLHFFHRMTKTADGTIAATMELMALHIDMAQRRSAPMPDDVYARVETTLGRHRELPAPPQLGRKIGIRR